MKDKKIILAISGSIAAYKCAFLTRLLVKSGAAVKVIMTPSATDFITPLTLSTLSKNPVFSDVSSDEGWHNHVELGLWADAIVVAPATANTLARMANGLCDNMLLAVYLSARCPVFFAPAMDLDMWTHPATQKNISTLQSYGNHLIPAEHGELASGLVGVGRMAEPENIVNALNKFFAEKNIKQDLAGKKAIVTSGPTHEAIDPVRFIGNLSTGRMGVSLAEELAQRGAMVTLISGPVNIKTFDENITTISVKSAQEMYEVANIHFPKADLAIMAAAVADYTPKTVSSIKIKKKSGDMHIALKRTKDIAYEIGKIKQTHQITVGFALETNNEIENAKKKLAKKNFDFIVLNSLNDKGAGFQHNTNKITILDKNGGSNAYELKSKPQVAKDIVDFLVKSECYLKNNKFDISTES